MKSRVKQHGKDTTAFLFAKGPLTFLWALQPGNKVVGSVNMHIKRHVFSKVLRLTPGTVPSLSCNVATCTWNTTWALPIPTPIWVLAMYLIKYSALHWNQSFSLVMQHLQANCVFNTLATNLCTNKWACILIMARRSPGFEMGEDLERLSSDKYPGEVRNSRQLWAIFISDLLRIAG